MPKRRGKSKASPKTKPVDPNMLNALTRQVIKVCRLCEGKDGPFLNIFNAEQAIDKKIENLMPFGIEENDDLPHKICFRCSAKVEELYEFIQKCIKTQSNLRIALGSRSPLITKLKTHRSLWEEKLNKTKSTNDDICDAVIKKAMEGIQDQQVLEVTPEKSSAETTRKPSVEVPSTSTSQGLTAIKVEPRIVANEVQVEDESHDEDVSVSVKKIDLKHSSCAQKSVNTRSSGSPHTEVLNDELDTKTKTKRTTKKKMITSPINDPQNICISTGNSEKAKEYYTSNGTSEDAKQDEQIKVEADSDVEICGEHEVENQGEAESHFKSSGEVVSQGKVASRGEAKVESKVANKPFYIMDHVSTIRVNGVGILFQCKLCNRNFLKRGVVKSHGCARNGVPKQDFTKHIPPPPEPRKVTTVKYINTNLNHEFQIPSRSQNAKGNKTAAIKKKGGPAKKTNTEKKKSVVPVCNPKRKIGPASKVKRQDTPPNIRPDISTTEVEYVPDGETKNSPSNEVSSPNSLKCRYKLVPGPNNTYALVEDKSDTVNQDTTVKEPLTITKASKKRNIDVDVQNSFESKSKEQKLGNCSKDVTQPYPVGLFQSLPKYSNAYTQPTTAEPVAFSTVAINKQAYTIPTGNPSKILISTKPQTQTPTQEMCTKAIKNPNLTIPPETMRPGVSSATPAKNSAIFTFINVDPLLEPSYVLPVDNVQEPQTSTSRSASGVIGTIQTNGRMNIKQPYTCNMCGEKFSREQKLRVHIHSHYNKMDEEDQLRTEKTHRKRGRKA